MAWGIGNNKFLISKKGRTNKYGAERVRSASGKKFDSKTELRRWEELLWLQKAGKIQDLQRQVKFDLIVNESKICSYIADFTYKKDGDLVVEDSKNPYLCKKDRSFIIKRKLMKALYGIEIKITGNG